MFDNLLDEIRPPDTWQHFIGWESDDAILIETHHSIDRYTLSTQSRETLLAGLDIDRVTLSPNRQYLAMIADEWRTFYVLDIATQTVFEFPTTNGYIKSLAMIFWSPDSQKLLIDGVSQTGEAGYYLINIVTFQSKFVTTAYMMVKTRIDVGWSSNSQWIFHVYHDSPQLYLFHVDDNNQRFMFGDDQSIVTGWLLLDDWLVLRMQNQASPEYVLSYVNLQTGESHIIPEFAHIYDFRLVK